MSIQHSHKLSGLPAVLAALVLSLVGHLQAQQQPRVPPDVDAHRDLAYVEGGHQKQKLDLYLPENPSAPLPLIIWIHGGGWAAGSKDGCPAARFVAQGYAAASLEYRLSGDAVFPAQIEDCKASIRWLRAHAKEYHLDPTRFGVWGSSAGGHLVALVGTSGDVKEFDVGANLDQSSRVQAVCDFYGPTDLLRFVTTPGYESHATAGSPESRLIGGIVEQNKDKAAHANPIIYVTKDDPPFLIVHGDKDPTVPPNQSELLFEALKKTGVSAHFHTIHGAGHGGPGFSGKNIDEMVATFFDAHLKNLPPPGSAPEALFTESTAAVSDPGRPQPPTRPTQNGGRRIIPWEAVLARDDKNHDGKISREEFSGPPALFDRIDRDHDGFITKEEHEAFFQNLPPAPKPGQP
jgi:acetyl esterase/lipase